MVNAAGVTIQTSADTNQFLQTLEFFSTTVSQNQIQIMPWAQPSLNKLVSLPDDRVTYIRKQFQLYVDLVKQELKGEVFDKDQEYTEAQLLASCAKKLGIVFDPSVYEKLQKQDIIEVYNQDFIQIYRNLSFFNLCSYNLLDLLTHEFYELYERSMQVTHLLIDATQVLIGRPYCLDPISLRHIPQHVMREKFSPERISFQMQFKEMYPIYTESKEFYGYLMVLEAEKIDQEKANIAFI